jgi:hypothetical protein
MFICKPTWQLASSISKETKLIKYKVKQAYKRFIKVKNGSNLNCLRKQYKNH